MNGEKSFWAHWHHVTDVEIVIQLFDHYVNFALTVGAVPGGLFHSSNRSWQMAVHPESGLLKVFSPLKWSFFLTTVALVLALGGIPRLECWISKNKEHALDWHI